jgi:hypothetical protein
VKQVLVALAIATLALFSFFIFPGHTYLTQDTQIYVPILENLWDPTVLRHDLLVGHSQVAYTLYDEYAIALRWLTGASFRVVLETTQIVCRAAGICGVYLMAMALLQNRAQSLAVAAVCAAGAEIWGPAVLLVEFEPSPRAFAIPLFFLAIGLASHLRFRWAAAIAAVAFVLHPTSVASFWVCLALLRQWRIGLVSLLAGATALAIGAHFQPGLGEHQNLFSRVTPPLEAIQRMRGLYNWVGMWWPAEWPKYAACLAVGAAAYARIQSLRPFRQPQSYVANVFLITLPVLGLLSVPVSYFLLDRAKWAAIPQIQPARLLLFTVAIPILLAAVAAVAAFRSRRLWEAPLWLACALTPAMAAPRPRIIPTPGLTELSRWAARNTPKDAVFLFPQAGKSLEPGLFRSEALRTVYVDWKGGGQANFLPESGLEWWHRYEDVMQKPQSLDHYRALGITHLVYPGYKVVALQPTP